MQFILFLCVFILDGTLIWGRRQTFVSGLIIMGIWQVGERLLRWGLGVVPAILNHCNAVKWVHDRWGGFLGGAWEFFQRSYIIVTQCLWSTSVTLVQNCVLDLIGYRVLLSNVVFIGFCFTFFRLFCNHPNFIWGINGEDWLLLDFECFVLFLSCLCWICKCTIYVPNIVLLFVM